VALVQQALTPQKETRLAVGALEVGKARDETYLMPNIGSSVLVVLYDKQSLVFALAHVLLPDSKLTATSPDSMQQILATANMKAKFMDLTLPELTAQFEAAGGQKAMTKTCLLGGSQLFNFGGGSGNPLNVGSRNAISARTVLGKLGYSVEKADIGGNKGRNVRFTTQDGLIYVNIIGGREYII
jgi:chemotaxis protein CheD